MQTSLHYLQLKILTLQSVTIKHFAWAQVKINFFQSCPNLMPSSWISSKFPMDKKHFGWISSSQEVDPHPHSPNLLYLAVNAHVQDTWPASSRWQHWKPGSHMANSMSYLHCIFFFPFSSSDISHVSFDDGIQFVLFNFWSVQQCQCSCSWSLYPSMRIVGKLRGALFYGCKSLMRIQIFRAACDNFPLLDSFYDKLGVGSRLEGQGYTWY